MSPMCRNGIRRGRPSTTIYRKVRCSFVRRDGRPVVPTQTIQWRRCASTSMPSTTVTIRRWQLHVLTPCRFWTECRRMYGRGPTASDDWYADALADITGDYAYVVVPATFRLQPSGQTGQSNRRDVYGGASQAWYGATDGLGLDKRHRLIASVQRGARTST